MSLRLERSGRGDERVKVSEGQLSLPKDRLLFWQTQVLPELLSHTAWLKMNERQDRTLPSLPDWTLVAFNLQKEIQHLDESIIEAARRGNGSFITIFMKEWYPEAGREKSEGRSVPAASYRAKELLLSFLELRTVPLKLCYPYLEAVGAIEAAGGEVPALPEEVNYLDDPTDPGPTNDSVILSLPTRIPGVMVRYFYKATFDFKSFERPGKNPESVGLVVTGHGFPHDLSYERFYGEMLGR